MYREALRISAGTPLPIMIDHVVGVLIRYSPGSLHESAAIQPEAPNAQLEF